MKKATPREKAAVLALAAGYIDTWEEAYLIASQKSEKEAATVKYLKSSVTHWKQHPEIAQAYQEAKTFLTARDESIKAAALEEMKAKRTAPEEGGKEEEGNREKAAESVRTESKPIRTLTREIDYNNPEARRQLYNRIISEAADDPKTQLDAAKLIEQTQRDDRQAAQDNKIQRVYMPVTCQTCPIFEKARNKGR